MILPILIVIFVAFVLYRLVMRLKANEVQLGEFLLWLIIWGAIGIIVWIPSVLDSVAKSIGIGRGVDAAIYIALVLIFYLIFRIYLKAEFQERELTQLVRHLAIREKESQKLQHRMNS